MSSTSFRKCATSSLRSSRAASRKRLWTCLGRQSFTRMLSRAETKTNNRNNKPKNKQHGKQKQHFRHPRHPHPHHHPHHRQGHCQSERRQEVMPADTRRQTRQRVLAGQPCYLSDRDGRAIHLYDFF